MLLGPDGRPLEEPRPEKPKPKKPRRKRTAKAQLAAEPPTASDAVREQLERAVKWVEPLGLAPRGAGFFFHWWKKLGLNWAIALSITLFVPVSQFSLLNFAMKHGVPQMFGDFGVAFDVGDWDLDLLGLHGTARTVRISRGAGSQPVLTAGAIEFNASLGSIVSWLRGKPQTFDEIIIRDADVKLEQSLTGDWNWGQLLDAVAANRREAVAAGQYQTKILTLDRVRIEYVENIPGRSGGGVIQSAQARIHADDVSGVIRDLVAPKAAADMPTTFELKGRTSDGIVQIAGRGAFFAPVGKDEPTTPLDIKVYLENIGMGAYGRMVSTTSLVPVRGTVRGTLEIKSIAGALRCRSTLVVDGVEFAPNPRIVLVRSQYDQLASDLSGYRTSGPFDPCDVDRHVPNRGATSVLASFNSQTTRTATAIVRAAAARDEQSFGLAMADSATADITGKLAQEAARRAGSLIGGNTGKTVERQGGNALTDGARSVGKGVKKLFGR